jgi:hypothetical protein
MSKRELPTEEELEKAGLEALRRELGVVGMIRTATALDTDG